MKEYEVRIRETLEKTVTVQANSPMEARNLVEKAWKDSEHILDFSNFAGVTFTVPPRHDRER